MVMNIKLNGVDFVSSVILVNFILILSVVTDIQQIDAASCSFANGQIGQCVKFEECESAIVLSKQGVNPGYCNLEEQIVCCTDSLTETPVKRRPFPEKVPQKWQNDYSGNKKPNINEQDTYEADSSSQRRKHSVGKTEGNSDENPNGRRKNIYDNQEPYKFERPENSFSESTINRRPNRRPVASNSPNDEGYFVPPGLAKKKVWREEKTTENDYFYEHVTKKPNRGPNRNPNRKNPGKHYGNNSPKHFDDSHNDQSGSNGRRTTEKYNGFGNPYEYEGSHSINEGPTKQNKWTQETYTTTKRYERPGNNYGQAEGGHYNVRPGERPSNQNNFNNRPNRPNNQQGSRPVDNNQPNYRPSPPKRRRISELKCEEYSREVTKNITGLPLTTNPDPVTISVRKCQRPVELIVGGENTTLGEFPHMAAIGFRDRNKKQITWNCGGTLISELFVMTAAHCTSTSLGRPVKVRLGEYNLSKNDDGAYPVDYAVVDIITHPEYKPPSKYHDIALLKLSRKVTFFKHIRPACLYVEDTFSVSMAIATGWGRLFYDGNMSEILQKVALQIVDNNTCNRLYKVNVKTEVLSRGIIDGQMCAGELTGGKDTCQGDSGGPLSITSTKCIHHVIGITSFGKSCALPNSTGVYTRVSAYLPWIESIVWPS